MILNPGFMAQIIYEKIDRMSCKDINDALLVKYSDFTHLLLNLA